MGATSKRAGEAARGVTSNPYLRRLLEDEELRDNIREAFEAARDAYQRVSNGKGAADTLIDDRKVHRDLRTAAESLRDASHQLRGRRSRSGGLGRWLLVALVGAVLVLILSEDARKFVLDKLFGAEEEFEYTSTTTPEPESVPTTS
jgi:ribosomal silencing factor RsfS